MSVLLSIKPKYVTKIINGEKRYEFRKTKPNKDKINKAYIYTTSPIKKITAKMVIDDILEGSPEEIWKKCKKYSGITKEEYFEYYENKDIAIALSIKQVEEFNDPLDPHKIIDNFVPPQSFYYLKKDIEL